MSVRTQRSSERLLPTKATGALATDLEAASKDYVFFVPYIPMIVFPRSGIDPVIYAKQNTGLPTSLMFWDLGEPVFSLGAVGRELSIGGHILFGVPKEEWETVENYARAIILKDTSKNWHFVTQWLSFQNPFEKMKPSNVSVCSFGLETNTGMFHMTPLRKVLDAVLSYRIIFNRSLGDDTLDAFVARIEEQ